MRLEAETKKTEAAAEAKKAEIEAAAQKETAKMKLEAHAERDRREFELEKSCMEHEFRMRNLGNAEQGGADADREQDTQNGRAARMKALKLPPFNEEKDDLDAYLTRFEGVCIVFEIRREHWSIQFARLLQGRSLEVYQRLAASEVDDYGALKAQLLKHFRLTEGGYRKKFKNSQIEPGETPKQFIERLREIFREMVDFEQNHEGLENLILRDLYFLTCDKALQTFLKERGKLSLKDMAKAANDYYEVHGYPTDSPSHKDNRSEVHAHDDVNIMHVSEPINPPFGIKHCDNCGLNNHYCSECRKPYARVLRNSSNNDIVCFQCNQMGTREINAQ